MADTGDIGDIGINLTADISEFETSLTQAASLAETTGNQIADALREMSSGGSELDAVTGQLNLFQEQITEAANAAQEAGTQFSLLGEEIGSISVESDNAIALSSALDEVAHSSGEAADAAGELGSASEGAAGGVERLNESESEGIDLVGQFTEHLTEMAVAFASFEALKELATDAVSAYSEVERASVALTALTGSAEQATESIEQMKQLALDNALSFPSLISAYQRMTALGFATEGIPKALQSVADAAAATGNSFDSVASRMDRMALSGTVNARSMASLGLSVQDMAAAMGTSDTTIKEVTASFQGLGDQNARLEVLETAMGKFAGVGQAMAQTLSGQFQNLKTNVEFSLEEMGAAFAPLLSVMMGWGNDVLSIVKEQTSIFHDFSTELMEFGANASEAFTIAAAPVAEFFDTITEHDPVMTTLKDHAGEVATEFAGNFVMSLNQGVTAVGAMAAVIKTLNLALENLTNGGAPANQMLQLMNSHLSTLQTAVAMGGQAFKDATAGGLTPFSGGARDVIDQVDTLQSNVKATAYVLNELTSAFQQHRATLQQVQQAQLAYNQAVTAAGAAASQLSKDVVSVVDPVQQAADAAHKGSVEWSNWAAAYNTINEALDAGRDTLHGVTIDINTLQVATDKMVSSFAQGHPAVAAAMTDIGAKAKDIMNATGAVDGLSDAAVGLFQKFISGAVDYDGFIAGLQKIATSGTDAAVVLTKGATSSLQFMDGAQKSTDAVTKFLGALDESVDSGKASIQVIGQAGQVLHDTFVFGATAATDAAKPFVATIDDGTNKLTPFDSALRLVNDDVAAMIAPMGGAADAVVKVGAAARDAAAQATALAAAHQAAAQRAGELSDASAELAAKCNAAADALVAQQQATKDMGDTTTQVVSQVNALAQADRDLADAADAAATSQGKVGKGGGAGGGGGMSMSQYLEDLLSAASSPLSTMNNATGLSTIDQMAQLLANQTGSVVQTPDGTFSPQTGGQAGGTANNTGKFEALPGWNGGGGGGTSAASTAVSNLTTAVTAATTATTGFTAGLQPATDATTAATTTLANLGNLSATVTNAVTGVATVLTGPLTTAAGTAGSALDALLGYVAPLPGAILGVTQSFDQAAADLTAGATLAASGLVQVATDTTATTSAVAQTAIAAASNGIVGLSNLLAAVGITNPTTSGALQPGSQGLLSSPTWNSNNNQPITLNVNVTGNNVAGDQSAQMLAAKVGQIIVQQLRTVGGLKL